MSRVTLIQSKTAISSQRRLVMDKSISPPPTKRRRLEERHGVSTSKETSLQNNNVLSIYSWNINGIQPFIQRPITSFFESSSAKNHSPMTTKAPQKGTPSTASSLRDFLRRHNWPTMLFLQEVKISPSDTATQLAVDRSVRAPTTTTKDASVPANPPEPSYRAHFSLPTDPHNARGFGRKVYGVCTLIRQDFLDATKATVRAVDWDQEGRFQVIETSACRNAAGEGWPKLSIWNIYAVNGTSNPYKDSKTGQVVGTRHDRKLAVHKLLLDECLGLRQQGYEVILAGDMNIARGVIDGFPNLRTFPEQHVLNRKDFNEKFFEDEQGFLGVDTFRHVHGEEKGYTYHPRGRPFGSSCDRVRAACP